MTVLRQNRRRAESVDRPVSAAERPVVCLPLILAALCPLAWAPLLATPGEQAPEAIRVAIPTDMATENLFIEIGIYAQGLFTEGVKGQKGVYEYEVPCRVSGIAKLYAYLPGYRVAHTNCLQPGASWAPAFERLEAVESQGTLTDTRGRPLPGQRLVLTFKMGSGEVHTDPVNVANDGDVLPQEYRRFLNRVFGPVRWLRKTAWKSSIDFCEHHTEPKNAFGVRLHFNPDYKF